MGIEKGKLEALEILHKRLVKRGEENASDLQKFDQIIRELKQ